MLTEVHHRHINPVYTHRTRGQRLRRRVKRNLKRAFLASYTRLGVVVDACQEIGIGRTTYYGWMKQDTHFRQQVESERTRQFDEQMKRAEQLYPIHSIATWSEGQLIRALKSAWRHEGRIY